MLIKKGTILIWSASNTSRSNLAGQLAGAVSKIQIHPRDITKYMALHPNHELVSYDQNWLSVDQVELPLNRAEISDARIWADDGWYYDSYDPLDSRFEIKPNFKSDWEDDFEMT